MVIRKSTLKRIGWVTLLTLLIAGIAVGITLADGDGATNGFTFQTAPLIEDLEFYLETNGNNVHDPEEFVGIFDVYDGNNEITFSWNPYTFPDDVNASYRISLWQDTNPLGDPVWVERKVAHHWAEQPTTFTMGAFGFGEEICTTCPSIISVTPEVYTLVETPNGYEYEYTSLLSHQYGHIIINGDGPLIAQSAVILIQIFRPAPAEEVCEPKPDVYKCTCELVNQQVVIYCENSCGEEDYPEKLIIICPI